MCFILNPNYTENLTLQFDFWILSDSSGCNPVSVTLYHLTGYIFKKLIKFYLRN